MKTVMKISKTPNQVIESSFTKTVAALTVGRASLVLCCLRCPSRRARSARPTVSAATMLLKPLEFFGVLTLLLSALPAISSVQTANQLAPGAYVTNVGGSDSYDPIITPGGRYVVFCSTSGNLAVGPGNQAFVPAFPGHMNVFLRDRQIGTTVLVSVNTAGTAGGGDDSFPCAISTNGQFVVFQSDATNLVAGNTEGPNNVFVRDTVNNTTTAVSIATNGGFGNDDSRDASMTPDGRYVAFVSSATNLTQGDTNGIDDVFVRDLKAGVTTLVSVGAQAFGGTNNYLLTSGSSSEEPILSADGRYVAFFSSAVGLAPSATNSGEVYLRDLTQGTTAWVSANARTVNSNAVAANYVMSTNGQFIAYQTANGGPAGLVFRYNTATGTTDDISTNGAVVTSLDQEARKIDISADGRFVAFTLTNSAFGASIQLWDAQSGTTSLVSGPGVANAALCDMPRVDQTGRYVAFMSDDAGLTTNSDGNFHVYVRDTTTGNVQLADALPGGAPISFVTTPFHLSADGGFVGFDCEDGVLSINPGKSDAFLRDLNSNGTEIISVPAPSLPDTAPLNSSQVSLSAISSNGEFVVFTSLADGIVSGDTNGGTDVYEHDFATGLNTLISVNSSNYSGNGGSQEAVVSADGRYVAFSSYATDLAGSDTNPVENVLVRDALTGTTTLVSVSTNGTSDGNNNSYSPQISADGQYVLFTSLANNLVTNHLQPTVNIYWRDLKAGVTRAFATSALAVMTPDGSNVLFETAGSPLGSENLNLWNSPSNSVTPVTTTKSSIAALAISPDAKHAAFMIGTTYAVDLVGGSNWVVGTSAATPHWHLQFSGDGRFLAFTGKDSTGTNQIQLYDFQSGTTTLVSQSINSTNGGNGACDSPTINNDGSFVAYRSIATDLVSGENGAQPNIFLYSRLTGAATLVTASEFGPWSANGESLMPSFSADGHSLLFESWASDLAAGDFNESLDAFVVSLSQSGGGSTNTLPTLTISTPMSVLSGQFSTNQPLELTWPAATGASYQVQYKDDLSDPHWHPVNGTVTNTGGQGAIYDNSPSPASRFYRIVSQ
jgi:hypothetical protein